MGKFMDTINKIGSVLGLSGSEQEGYDGYDDQGQYVDDGQGQYAQDPYNGYEGGYEGGYEEQTYEQPRASETGHSRRHKAAQEYEQPEVNNVFAGRSSSTRDNVVPMNASERKPQKLRVENLMPEVSNEALMNEACENIINRVMSGEILIISTVNVDDKQRTRMVLMLSGAAFAMNAHFTRVNSITYMMVPKGVEISQESAKPRTPSFFESSDFFGSR